MFVLTDLKTCNAVFYLSAVGLAINFLNYSSVFCLLSPVCLPVNIYLHVGYLFSSQLFVYLSANCKLFSYWFTRYVLVYSLTVPFQRCLFTYN